MDAELAVNGRGNQKLFHDVPDNILARHSLEKSSEGPVRLDSVEKTLRALVGEALP